jgi:large subunit ribosomal protein L3
MHWGLIVKKQEMTRLWNNGKMIPVTLVMIPWQVVVRYKTMEKDGYAAVVVGTPSKKTGSYTLLKEFACDEASMQNFPVGSTFVSQLIDGAKYTLVGISKGKGFQGVIKRHHFSGGPASHGSKFHRAGWSTGNRKPRRTHKNHPMAGHMGSEKTTLKGVQLISRYTIDNQHILAFAGSLPGAYNTSLFVHC